MKRFWLLLRTELLAWGHDPITALGGLIPPAFILLAFGFLFGGRLSFDIAVINHDAGPMGAVLRQTFNEVLSPFETPYYELFDGNDDEAWTAYRSHDIDGVWVIPEDFSRRMEAGEHPVVKMYFSNYNDDRAKNHRIYSAEIMWQFYRTINMPPPPVEMEEEYPLPVMIEWFPVIAVGVLLLSFMLGGMINMFMLTHKEQVNRLTLEFGLAPRRLIWVLLPKTLLALATGLLTGTVLLCVLYFLTGSWPGRFFGAVLLPAGLVILFWVPPALLVGMRTRFFSGMTATILTGLTIFFTGGGLGMVRSNWEKVPFFSLFFPNIYAVDPLRDLILFHTWPQDWTRTLLILSGFAVMSLAVCFLLASQRMRRAG